MAYRMGQFFVVVWTIAWATGSYFALSHLFEAYEDVIAIYYPMISVVLLAALGAGSWGIRCVVGLFDKE